VYFPLIVEEALMIEPTESENVETLDRFAEAMLEIAREAREEPDKVKSAPHSTPVGRVDEAGAARKPDLCWRGRCGLIRRDPPGKRGRSDGIQPAGSSRPS